MSALNQPPTTVNCEPAMNRNPPPSMRDEVLREAGHKCANPTCRNILTLQLHHMVWVKDGGGTEAINLIALCGHCHDMHTCAGSA